MSRTLNQEPMGPVRMAMSATGPLRALRVFATRALPPLLPRRPIPWRKCCPGRESGIDTHDRGRVARNCCTVHSAVRGRSRSMVPRRTTSNSTIITVTKQWRRATNKTSGAGMNGQDRTLTRVTSCSGSRREPYLRPQGQTSAETLGYSERRLGSVHDPGLSSRTPAAHL
jgi:hypothetical protein